MASPTESPSSRIFHIAIADDWETSLGFGTYEASTRGKSLDDEGFIHAVTAEQLERALNRYSDLQLPLVLLALDTKALQRAGIEVEWAESEAGVPQPRIRGAIPTGGGGIVVEEAVLRREGGHWLAPAEDGPGAR